jgi:hypothetical protein
MELAADLDAPCPPEELFAWVGDLARYPSWLSIVTRAEAYAGAPLAWSVDLRGRVGPFARSKRLRMVRTSFEPPRLAAFERQEDDGRQHAAWVLRAEVSPMGDGEGSHLAMRLRYDGALWGPVIERLLADEIEQGRLRLLELVSAPRR